MNRYYVTDTKRPDEYETIYADYFKREDGGVAFYEVQNNDEDREVAFFRGDEYSSVMDEAHTRDTVMVKMTLPDYNSLAEKVRAVMDGRVEIVEGATT